MPLQLKIKSWAIYYDNKVVTTGSTMDEWLNRENEGVQCVALFYEDGKPEIFRGKDLYLMYDGKHGLTFASVNRPSPMIELAELDAIKIGKLIESHDHFDIMKTAQEQTYGS